MNIELLKQLGNMDQIAGIRESRLLHGRGAGVHLAEFYNAAGLRFSVVPDRCMDLYDCSYKGVNLSFHTKNGLVSPQSFTALEGEFTQQWSGGMLVTCGLDNVGGHAEDGIIYPVHGRVSNIPAQTFGTKTFWEGDDYVLRASGEMHQTRLYGHHLSLRRTVETSLHGKSIKIHDVITNFEAEDAPYVMLYHWNFGYPLLQADSRVQCSDAEILPVFADSVDPDQAAAPKDGAGEQGFWYINRKEQACAVLYNERLELGAYIAYDTANLPRMYQWKNMKSHDYVMGLEPCNFTGLSREEALSQGKMALIPAYSGIENKLEFGVLDGNTEIREFLKNL